MSDFLLSSLLRSWYDDHKRDLPWRQTRDPYRIWISEIILQQTRVQQGLDYYNRFISRFPDVLTLAGAPLDEVLKYWQGLGYYSRARNLHAAACQICHDFGGVFPHRYPDILSLKGVGSYTAAAIASFSYDLPYAVLDGNVYRVLSRLFDVSIPIDTNAGKKAFQQLADQILDPVHAAQHNQAMMEFGALYCTPSSPDCPRCPLQHKCAAFAAGTVASLPVKQGKTAVRERWFYYFVPREDHFTWMYQRSGKDIWSHLYEFPLIETDHAVSDEELIATLRLQPWCPAAEVGLSHLMSRKHILSHQHIHAVFYGLTAEGEFRFPDGYLKIPFAEVADYPVSRLTHLCLEQL